MISSAKEDCYQRQLHELVLASSPLMDALKTVRSLGLSSWCIGAGVIRALVWDSLHGFRQPSKVDDLDVAYFDAQASLAQDERLARQLNLLLPDRNCEVTNQARVHEWYAKAFGRQVPALNSLEEGLASWPEYATCVGVFLDDADTLHVIAPYGLSDLFQMRVRHNPLRATPEMYTRRVESKRFKEKWPKLIISKP
ncbi:MAG: nucleotidyltransferase family protein [Burkholderiaceae bacterium]